MPLITIQSLPRENVDINGVLVGICRDISQEFDIDLAGLKAIWQELAVGSMVARGEPVTDQLQAQQPQILVDILGPDDDIYTQLNTSVEAVMVFVAERLADRLSLPLEAVFINYRLSYTGRVFEGGVICRW